MVQQSPRSLSFSRLFYRMQPAVDCRNDCANSASGDGRSLERPVEKTVMAKHPDALKQAFEAGQRLLEE